MSEKIPKGWKWMKLGDVVIINPNETLKKGIIAKKVPMEALLPFTKKVKFFVFEKYNGGVKFKNGDTLVARITPSLENGKTVYVDLLDDNEIGFGSTEFIVLREKSGITDKQFVYYFAISNDFRDVAIKSMTGSSGRQRVQNEVVKEFEFLLPPLLEQKAIAEVLSSLDDKIDLLHRQNKTLEKMAMTLFRQWFIEPTKDGLPEGWEEVSLGDIFDIGIGRTPPRKESQWFSVNQHDIRWISVKDLGSIDTYILNSSEFLKEEAVKEFNIPIIPDNTVVLSFKLTVGRIGITIGEMVSNEAIAHFKLKPDSKISSNYLYLFLKTLDFSAFGSTSSIAEAINTKIIKEIKILVPNDELITSFQSLINPVFQKIRLNTLEIQTLEKLRDTLLPKLMSGEVRVMKK